MLRLRHDIGNDIPSHCVYSVLGYGVRLLCWNKDCPFAYDSLSDFISILSFTYTSISHKEVSAKATRRE